MKKNFKRLLCLVLVVSLVCSLAVTASAASLSDYTDVDDITYVEAVDVLTGVGILEGTDGAFNGSENMTRAQAAKIIAYLALGAETASSLSATSAPFDDVPLTHWAVGYIAYCASAGIIDGDGTGNFNPDDEVTAYQFGKMLLCTLGYGVNGEYTGSGDVQSTSNDTETAQFWVNGSKVTYEFDDGDIDSDWYKFQGGWIEIGSDGLATFTPFDGTASDKDSDSIDIDINGRQYVFSFADDYEKTRLKSGGSGSSSSPSAGDYVWVFTEDPADSSSDYTSEAIAVIAIDEDNSNISSLLSNIGYTAYSAD
ncbi:MAG: S-layer homology domain-containing protein [Oscillospiraceae bacterium]|nr:S-layer homology domain-containing protein [Oscillospiraceae bacterium]